MQVVEGDLLKLQPAEAAVDSGSKLVRPAVGFPFSFHGVLKAALGGDRDTSIRVQRLAHHGLGRSRTVRVGRIDKVHAKFNRAAQQLNRVSPGRAEAALLGQVDRALAQPRDRELARAESDLWRVTVSFYSPICCCA